MGSATPDSQLKVASQMSFMYQVWEKDICKTMCWIYLFSSVLFSNRKKKKKGWWDVLQTDATLQQNPPLLQSHTRLIRRYWPFDCGTRYSDVLSLHCFSGLDKESYILQNISIAVLQCSLRFALLKSVHIKKWPCLFSSLQIFLRWSLLRKFTLLVYKIQTKSGLDLVCIFQGYMEFLWETSGRVKTDS